MAERPIQYGTGRDVCVTLLWKQAKFRSHFASVQKSKDTSDLYFKDPDTKVWRMVDVFTSIPDKMACYKFICENPELESCLSVEDENYRMAVTKSKGPAHEPVIYTVDNFSNNIWHRLPCGESRSYQDIMDMIILENCAACVTAPITTANDSIINDIRSIFYAPFGDDVSQAEVFVQAVALGAINQLPHNKAIIHLTGVANSGKSNIVKLLTEFNSTKFKLRTFDELNVNPNKGDSLRNYELCVDNISGVGACVYDESVAPELGITYKLNCEYLKQTNSGPQGKVAAKIPYKCKRFDFHNTVGNIFVSNKFDLDRYVGVDSVFVDRTILFETNTLLKGQGIINPLVTLRNLGKRDEVSAALTSFLSQQAKNIPVEYTEEFEKHAKTKSATVKTLWETQVHGGFVQKQAASPGGTKKQKKFYLPELIQSVTKLVEWSESHTDHIVQQVLIDAISEHCNLVGFSTEALGQALDDVFYSKYGTDTVKYGSSKGGFSLARRPNDAGCWGKKDNKHYRYLKLKEEITVCEEVKQLREQLAEKGALQTQVKELREQLAEKHALETQLNEMREELAKKHALETQLNEMREELERFRQVAKPNEAVDDVGGTSGLPGGTSGMPGLPKLLLNYRNPTTPVKPSNKRPPSDITPYLERPSKK